MPIDIIPGTLAPHWHDEARACIAAAILATDAIIGPKHTIRPRLGPLAGEYLDEPDAVDLGRRILSAQSDEEISDAIADWADEAIGARADADDGARDAQSAVALDDDGTEGADA